MEKQQVMLATIVVDLARGQKGTVGDELGSKSGTSETLGMLAANVTMKAKSETDDATLDWNKFKKVEMPMFNGVDPDGWLSRADRYFQIHRLMDSEKMTVAVISLDGVALDWYRAQEERDSFSDWKNLKNRLLMRFRLERDGSLLSIFGN